MTGIAVGSAFLLTAAVGWSGGVVILLAGLFVVLLGGMRPSVVPAVLVVMLASGLGIWRGGGAGVFRADPEPNVPAWVDLASGIQGVVVVPPTATGRGQNLDLAISAVRLGTRAEGLYWEPNHGRVCIFAPAFPLVRIGDEVRLSGRTRPLIDLDPALRAALRSRACEATMYATWAEIESRGRAGPRRALADVAAVLTGTLRSSAPGDAGALLAGLVTGDDHALAKPRRAAFLRTGTSHITAVSGANIALVVGAATALGRAGGWRRRLVWQIPTLAAIWSYALMTGFGSPVARAALVASGAVLAARVGRRPDLLTLTVLAAAAMIAVDPDQLRRASFQLSFASSLGLVAVFTGTAPTGIRGWGEALVRASVTAQLATLPIVLALFGSISLFSLPANFLIGPLVAVAFPLSLSAAVGGLVVPSLSGAIAFPANVAAAAIFVVVDALAAVEGSVWLMGKASVASIASTAALVVAALIGMSPDGRNWVRRCMLDWGDAGPNSRTVFIGGLVGVLLGSAVSVIFGLSP